MTVDTEDLESQDASAEEAAPASSSSSTVHRQTGKPVDYQGAGKRLAERCLTDARNNQARLDRDRQDWQNLLMYRGGQSQWMIYDRGTNTYVARGNDPDQGGLPDWVPRPSTNIFGLKIDQLVSLMNRTQPAKLFAPATDDDRDRAAAEVAEDADPVLQKEIGYDLDRPQLNKLAALTNGAAYVLYYDTDPRHGMTEIPLFRCPGCGVIAMPEELDDAGGVCPGDDGTTPGCGTKADDFEPAIDSRGKPWGIPYPRGKMCAQVVSSFEYSLPSTARVADVKRVPWFLTHSGMATEDILARWGARAKKAIDKHGGKKVGGTQRAFARAMRQLSSPSRANAPAAAGGSSTHEDAVVYILQHDPIDDGEFYFPDGLLIVLIEDEIMETGPLPLADDEGRKIKSALIRSYMQGPGTAFGKPPADDLVPLQISRNLVDSLIQLILMHDAAPRSWIPLSVTLENEPTGRPGENIWYRSTIPGEKPQTQPGINPPEGLYKYLEIIDQKFEEISKLNAVLGGQRPEGDPTLGEVQILQEQGMSSFNEPLDQLLRFEEDLTRLLLFWAKQSAWADRFRQVTGDNGQWDVKKFNAADLDGRISIQIDPQSAWPKSPSMRLARMEKALKMGVLPPPAQDPELQTQMLLEMDLLAFKPSINIDRKQVARELDLWRAAHEASEIHDPDPTIQNLPIHLHFKQQFLKTEEFELLREANTPLADAIVAHVQKVQQLVSSAQTPKAEPPKTSIAAKADLSDPDVRKVFEQAYGIPPTPPPPPPAPAGAPPAPAAPPPPDGSHVTHALATGAIVPAGSQPPPDHLGHAVNSGALVPAAAQAPGPSLDDLIAHRVVRPLPPAPPASPEIPHARA